MHASLGVQPSGASGQLSALPHGSTPGIAGPPPERGDVFIHNDNPLKVNCASWRALDLLVFRGSGVAYSDLNAAGFLAAADQRFPMPTGIIRDQVAQAAQVTTHMQTKNVLAWSKSFSKATEYAAGRIKGAFENDLDHADPFLVCMWSSLGQGEHYWAPGISPVGERFCLYQYRRQCWRGHLSRRKDSSRLSMVRRRDRLSAPSVHLAPAANHPRVWRTGIGGDRPRSGVGGARRAGASQPVKLFDSMRVVEKHAPSRATSPRGRGSNWHRLDAPSNGGPQPVEEVDSQEVLLCEFSRRCARNPCA